MQRLIAALLLAAASMTVPLPAAAAPASDAPAPAAPEVTIGFQPLTTAEAGITLRGSAPRGQVVRILVNEQLQGQVVAMSSMDVYRTPITLQPGPNRIVVEHEPSGARAEALVYHTTVTFADIKNHKLAADIEILATLGVVNGMGDGRFNPDAAVTRAQFAKLVVAGLGLQPEEGAALPFTDAGQIQAWAVPYVAAALKHGLMTGYPDGTFAPNRSVSRLEVAVVASRGLKQRPKVRQKPARPFADQGAVPAWARADVEAAMAAGVIDDFLGESLQPARGATRAETAAAIRRLRESFWP